MGRYAPPPLPERRFVVSLEETRRLAREDWEGIREDNPSKLDLEDVRRQALRKGIESLMILFSSLWK
jgi:hypothetical protein